MAVLNYLRSTILSKMVMAGTGVILLLFIVGHLVGNLQMFVGQDVFNQYAQFLQGLGELLWVIRGVLLLSLVLHIITSIYLNSVNNAAKPVKYQIKKYVKAKLNSRSMLVTGLLIFGFLSYHILHLTMGVTNPEHYDNHQYYTGNAYNVSGQLTVEQLNSLPESCIEKNEVVMVRHDVYKMVVLGFREPLITIAYLLFVATLGFHLSHAIQSCFQTLGITGPKFTPAMVKCSIGFSVIITVLYMSIPISILLGIVGGSI